MNGTQKIRKALVKSGMDEGAANAARIDKAFYPNTMEYGWHYTPFNGIPRWLGSTIAEALELIERDADALAS